MHSKEEFKHCAPYNSVFADLNIIFNDILYGNRLQMPPINIEPSLSTYRYSRLSNLRKLSIVDLEELLLRTTLDFEFSIKSETSTQRSSK